MRIAIWHNLPSGGGKRALYDQVRGLLARGHEIEAWCPDTADATFLPLEGLIPEHRLPLERPGRTDWDKRLHIPAAVEGLLEGMDRHCRGCAEQMAGRGFDFLLAHPCAFLRSPPIGQ